MFVDCRLVLLLLVRAQPTVAVGYMIQWLLNSSLHPLHFLSVARKSFL